MTLTGYGGFVSDHRASVSQQRTFDVIHNDFAIGRRLYDLDALGSIWASLQQKNLLGRSQLTGVFQQSQGFGVAFPASAAAKVRGWLPCTIPLLEAVSGFRTQANAFYFNVLAIAPGQHIDWHVDATLAKMVGEDILTPLRVSTLYVKSRQGGELDLRHADGSETSLTTGAGDIIHFRGDIEHRVRPTAGDTRVSFVLEQYRLNEDQLRRVPALCDTTSVASPFKKRSGIGAFRDLLR